MSPFILLGISTTKTSEFVQLLPSRIELSRSHLIFLQDQDHPVPAGTIEVGDVLRSGEAVTAIRHVKRQGVFAPFTPSGTMIVNDQMASTFVSLQAKSDVLMLKGHWSTGISHHWLAHVFEMPHRLWCQDSSRCVNESYTPDGISTWVSAPQQFFNWFLKTHALLQLSLTIPILGIFVSFAFFEWLTNHNIMLSSIVIMCYTISVMCSRFQTNKSKVTH